MTHEHWDEPSASMVHALRRLHGLGGSARGDEFATIRTLKALHRRSLIRTRDHAVPGPTTYVYISDYGRDCIGVTDGSA